MKGKISLYVAVALLTSGCNTLHHHHPEHKANVDEPGLIAKPFHYTGRTWFDTDKAFLRPAGKKELDHLAQQLITAQSDGRVSPENKILVVGHTDSRASYAYNQRLSERRAASVANYLVSKGINATAIAASGKGKTQPVASNRTAAGMQKNRRVEIHIAGPSIKVVYN